MHLLGITGEEKINTGRQFELDIAKGLAVVFMIMVHTQLYFASGAASEQAFGTIVDYLGGPPSAVVFMFVLGVGIVYTKKSSFVEFLKRGVLLILLGYALNLVRTLLSPAFNGFQDVDILQFAGLATIFVGAVKALKLSNFKTALIGLALAFLNILLRAVDASDVTGLFFGSEHYSFFPFLSWIFFPLAGHIFGDFLIRCKCKKRFYVLSGVLALAICLISYVTLAIVLKTDYGWVTDEAYYHLDIKGNIIFTSFTIAWISFLAGLGAILPGFIRRTIERWSRNVTPIYIIQWLLICGVSSLTGTNVFGSPAYIFIMVGMIAASDMLAYLYRRIKK
ncbi:MAG: heparan-alpha-glucosaminide N-acetyltransferase domain-containing protein [Bacillota bacterium]|nr:heparan-alpha-glucosaminide N-acetyltransferase domain-containing protein [Bacillota bacterium]